MNQTQVNAKELKAQIRDLIDLGYESFYSLNQDDKEQLTAYYISLNKTHNEFLAQSDNYDTVVNLLVDLMKKHDADTKEIMIDEMKAVAVKYYEETLSEIFDAEFTDIEHSKKYENGMSKRYHADNGEMYWVCR